MWTGGNTIWKFTQNIDSNQPFCDSIVSSVFVIGENLYSVRQKLCRNKKGNQFQIIEAMIHWKSKIELAI